MFESRKFKKEEITATKASTWYDYIPAGRTDFGSVCSVVSIYIIQAWADLRCLSFLEGNARA